MMRDEGKVAKWIVERPENCSGYFFNSQVRYLRHKAHQNLRRKHSFWSSWNTEELSPMIGMFANFKAS